MQGNIKFRKILGVFTLLVLTIGVFVGVYLIRRFVIYRSQAAGTASIYFDPASATLPPDKTFSLKVNSGASKVVFVKAVITFNRQQVNLASEIQTSGIWVVPEQDDGTKLISSMQQANATGKAEMVFIIPVDKRSQAPSGTFDIAQIAFKSVTSSATQNPVSFSTGEMEIVDGTNTEDMAISATNLSLNLNSSATASPIASGAYYVATNGNDSNPGSQSQPWRTIAKASSTLQAGNTVYVRAGTYQEKISPSRSGSDGKPITYSAYPGETVNINVTSGAAVPLDGRAYVVINGFTVDTNNTGSWVTAGSSTNHNTISNNYFKNSRDGAMGVNFSGPSYNKILNNTFEKAGANNGGGFDALILQDGASHNLIEGNKFTFGEHTLIKVSKTATQNVIRGNYFQNDWEKDTETNDNAHHNLWEKNTFATTKLAGDGQDSPGIQFSSPQNIFRYNVFYGAQGGGFRPEGYSGEASAVQNSRIFNNVFYANKKAGIYIRKFESGPNLSGTIYKNNISYKNIHNESASNPQQLFIDGLSSSNLDNNKFIKNNFFSSSASDNVIGHNSAGSHPVSWWQTNYPNNFSGNLQVDPKFVNATAYNFELQATSPMKDAGDSLTKTTSAGSGTTIPVEDALYFFDGFGITDGDMIIVGSNSQVKVTAVDYTNNRLTVARSISWNTNDPVNLPYAGSAPDMGAFEYGLSGGPSITPTPSPTTTPTPSPTPGAPTVDIKANNSNGPLTINSNTSATLSWTSSNATSCTASGGWSGSRSTSGSTSTGNLAANRTYTLTCQGDGGNASDSVTINVIMAATATPTASPTVTPTATPTPEPVDARADINGDKKINLLDYIILLENFGKQVP